MKKTGFEFGAGALLFLLALYSLGNTRNMAAVLLPILAHEAGHLLAFWLLGLPLRRFRIELRGLCIEYGGAPGPFSLAFAASAGPLAGLIYAFACSRCGNRLNSDWLCLTAGVSLLLSVFNLLPALPLDGGTLLNCLCTPLFGERTAGKLCEVSGILVSACLLGLGFHRMLHGSGIGLVLAAIWLLLSQEDGQGLVKRREII